MTAHSDSGQEVSRVDTPPRRRHALLNWKGLVGIVISAALLWYAFRDVHLREIWEQIRRANIPLLILSGIVVTLPFPLRALRWKPLLEPALSGSKFRPRFAATSIGFMANNLLPARVGEFVRAYALTRLEPVRLSASFGSLVVERLFDGITVILLLIVALSWPGFPHVTGRDFSGIATVAAIAVVVLSAVLLAMVVRPGASVRLFERTIVPVLPGNTRRRVVDALEAFLEGLSAIRDWRLVLRVFGWSLLIWLSAGVGTWIGLHAFGIELPLIAGVFLQSIIALAVAIPSAPGFFGVFEAAARIGLVEIWGVASTPALAFAIGFHMVGFVPITVIGLYYVWRLGLSWNEMEGSEEVVETAVETGVDPEGSTG